MESPNNLQVTNSHGTTQYDFDVVVAVPPEEVYLESNGKRISGWFDAMNFTNEIFTIDCIAIGGMWHMFNRK